MHLVLPTRHKLFRGLRVLATDSAVTSQMKTRVAIKLENYFPISDLHRTAVLLDPRLKDNATSLASDDRCAATESLRHLVESVEEESLPDSRQTDSQQHSSQGTSGGQEPPQKKRKKDDGFFSDFYPVASAATVNEVSIIQDECLSCALIEISLTVTNLNKVIISITLVICHHHPHSNIYNVHISRTSQEPANSV